METIAIIPARKGSKGIPHKNRQLIGTHSLVEWSVLALKHCSFVDKIILSTDDEVLHTLQAKYSLFPTSLRPSHYSSDTSTTESVISHVIEQYIPLNSKLLLVQPTSPFRSLRLFQSLVSVVQNDRTSSLSVFPDHLFIWSQDGIPNYDISNRPRRQDIPPSESLLIETGSLFAFTRNGFLEHNNRLYGDIVPVISSQTESLEIDTPLDLIYCRSIFESGALEPSILKP